MSDQYAHSISASLIKPAGRPPFFSVALEVVAGKMLSINSIENMLEILEQQCNPGTLGKLVIVGHGEGHGRFELGDRLYRFDQMTEKQIERLYNLLSPNAIIDLRFCYGIKDKHREKVVQQLANKLRCKIRAYAGQVSQKGKRPGIVKDEEIPWIEKVFYYDPRGKTFYPK